MPEITREISVAANSTETDVLNGTRLENVPRRARAYRVDVYATASATGINHEAFADSDNFIESGAVSAQNRVPLKDRDRTASVLVTPGTRLQINATNTTGSAETYFLTVSANPV